jgi:hypothetical protein
MIKDNVLRKLVEDSQDKNEVMSHDLISRLEALKKDTEKSVQIASTNSVLGWLGL